MSSDDLDSGISSDLPSTLFSYISATFRPLIDSIVNIQPVADGVRSSYSALHANAQSFLEMISSKSPEDKEHWNSFTQNSRRVGGVLLLMGAVYLVNEVIFPPKASKAIFPIDIEPKGPSSHYSWEGLEATFKLGVVSILNHATTRVFYRNICISYRITTWYSHPRWLILATPFSLHHLFYPVTTVPPAADLSSTGQLKMPVTHLRNASSVLATPTVSTAGGSFFPPSPSALSTPMLSRAATMISDGTSNDSDMTYRPQVERQEARAPLNQSGFDNYHVNIRHLFQSSDHNAHSTLRSTFTDSDARHVTHPSWSHQPSRVYPSAHISPTDFSPLALIYTLLDRFYPLLQMPPIYTTSPIAVPVHMKGDHTTLEHHALYAPHTTSRDEHMSLAFALYRPISLRLFLQFTEKNLFLVWWRQYDHYFGISLYDMMIILHRSSIPLLILPPHVAASLTHSTSPLTHDHKTPQASLSSQVPLRPSFSSSRIEQSHYPIAPNSPARRQMAAGQTYAEGTSAPCFSDRLFTLQPKPPVTLLFQQLTPPLTALRYCLHPCHKAFPQQQRFEQSAFFTLPSLAQRYLQNIHMADVLRPRSQLFAQVDGLIVNHISGFIHTVLFTALELIDIDRRLTQQLNHHRGYSQTPGEITPLAQNTHPIRGKPSGGLEVQGRDHAESVQAGVDPEYLSDIVLEDFMPIPKAELSHTVSTCGLHLSKTRIFQHLATQDRSGFESIKQSVKQTVCDTDTPHGHDPDHRRGGDNVPDHSHTSDRLLLQTILAPNAFTTPLDSMNVSAPAILAIITEGFSTHMHSEAESARPHFQPKGALPSAERPLPHSLPHDPAADSSSAAGLSSPRFLDMMGDAFATYVPDLILWSILFATTMKFSRFSPDFFLDHVYFPHLTPSQAGRVADPQDRTHPPSETSSLHANPPRDSTLSSRPGLSTQPGPLIPQLRIQIDDSPSHPRVQGASHQGFSPTRGSSSAVASSHYTGSRSPTRNDTLCLVVTFNRLLAMFQIYLLHSIMTMRSTVYHSIATDILLCYPHLGDLETLQINKSHIPPSDPQGVSMAEAPPASSAQHSINMAHRGLHVLKDVNGHVCFPPSQPLSEYCDFIPNGSAHFNEQRCQTHHQVAPCGDTLLSSLIAQVFLMSKVPMESDCQQHRMRIYAEPRSGVGCTATHGASLYVSPNPYGLDSYIASHLSFMSLFRQTLEVSIFHRSAVDSQTKRHNHPYQDHSGVNPSSVISYYSPNDASFPSLFQSVTDHLHSEYPFMQDIDSLVRHNADVIWNYVDPSLPFEERPKEAPTMVMPEFDHHLHRNQPEPPDMNALLSLYQPFRWAHAHTADHSTGSHPSNLVQHQRLPEPQSQHLHLNPQLSLLPQSSPQSSVRLPHHSMAPIQSISRARSQVHHHSSMALPKDSGSSHIGSSHGKTRTPSTLSGQTSQYVASQDTPHRPRSQASYPIPASQLPLTHPVSSPAPDVSQQPSSTLSYRSDQTPTLASGAMHGHHNSSSQGPGVQPDVGVQLDQSPEMLTPFMSPDGLRPSSRKAPSLDDRPVVPPTPTRPSS